MESSAAQLTHQHIVEDIHKSHLKIQKSNRQSNKNLTTTSKSNTIIQRSGRWDENENALYKLFLEQNYDLFQDNETRKYNRIFTVATKSIYHRSATQIRSHHQKMMKKYGSVQNIISQIKGSLKPQQQSPITQNSYNTEHFLNSKTAKQNKQSISQPGSLCKLYLLSQNQQENELKQSVYGFNLQFQSPRAFIDNGSAQVWCLDDVQL